MSQKTPTEKSTPDLVKEIQAEFSGQFKKVGLKVDFLIKTYPRLVFISMVLLIILSAITSFFTPLVSQFGQTQNDFKESMNKGADATSTELGLLFDLGGRAKRLFTIQKEVERLLSKETLSQKDSLFLNKAWEELEYYEKNKQKPYED